MGWQCQPVCVSRWLRFEGIVCHSVMSLPWGQDGKEGSKSDLARPAFGHTTTAVTVSNKCLYYYMPWVDADMLDLQANFWTLASPQPI